jgi:hypothetical protein
VLRPAAFAAKPDCCACSLKEERMAQHLLLRVTDILKLSDCLRGVLGVVDVALIQYNGEYHG